MDKVWKWAGAVFVASACGVLSAFSFQGWESTGGSTNKVIAMLLALQNFLVGLLGGMATGLLFAACAIAVLVLAWRHQGDGPKSSDV